MPKFAANISLMFTEWPFPDRFQAAADAGFGAVEFLFPYEYPADVVAARREAAGVDVVLFNLRPGDFAAGDRGLAALPGRRDAFRASVDEALVYAAALTVPRLHVMAGIADPADPAARAAYEDSLSEAADRLGAAGLDLMIEPINGRDMPGYFLNGFDLAAEIIARVGRPNVRLQYDVYHRQILHGDVLTSLTALMPLIGHVQIAAVPGRNEPGTGELDDGRILRTLDDLGYRGHVGCEYRPRGATLDGLGWLGALTERRG
ncbi:2-oxo-tetronate isomerase [Chthonobacter rhizosphaerae]|uniref:2-oxo-tetronate isomerase n=1 Tax=Chthonobacter rhizosphaerae TaxID=2735553 RepID=UPI0015EEC5A4|nr:2-oxo-tetronate isomerase [Chthonobacter rhizosphaerae]